MRGRWDEIRELTRIRVLLMVREPEAVFWVIFFPVVLAVVLGFAFARDRTSSSKVAILAGPGADRLAASLAARDDLEVERIESEAVARKQLLKGAVDAVVRPGEDPLLRYDPGRPEGAVARLRVLTAWRAAESSEPLAAMQEETETDTGSRYIDFLFPGLLGMNLMGTGVWGIGFAVVDTRRKKLLKRMIVTPMRRLSFLLSFILSRMVFMVVEVAVLLFFGLVVLGVPFTGSTVTFAAFCLLGTLCFSGLGLLIASRVRTMEGASGMMNVLMMPMWLGGGIFFSYERFPEVLHPLCRAIPLTALNDALRAITLDGAGFGTLVPELLILAAWGLGCFILAVKLFRWQ